MSRDSQEFGKCTREHPVPKGVLMGCGFGGFVDLSNMPDTGAVLTRAAIDTTSLGRHLVKIDFSTVLGYSLNMLEEFDLVFILYRQNEKGEMTELASWPYKALMDQLLTGAEEDQYAYVILEKNESFSVAFCEEFGCGGYATYGVKVQSNYFNVTSAIIQSSIISIMAQSIDRERPKPDHEDGGTEHNGNWD